MASDPDTGDEAERREGEDPGLLGGGGPAGTIYGDEDSLDEHGDDLTKAGDD